jgi:hypothetical protein
MKDANNPQQQGSALLTQDVMHLLLSLTLTRKTMTQTLRVVNKVTTAKETLHPKHPMWEKAVEHVLKAVSVKDIEAKFILSEDYKIMLEAAK